MRANTAIYRYSTLATVAVDGQVQVQLWRMPYLTHPAAALCALAGKSYSPDEWKQAVPGIPYQQNCP